MAIEPSWKNVSSYTVFIAGAHEWLSSADYVFSFFFSSPFSRTTEGCAQTFTLVSKILALSTVLLCLGCRSPPPSQFIMFGVEHLCNLLTKRQQMWQHCSWGWKQKWHLSALNVSSEKADVWRQHISGEGASDEWTSPLNQISCKSFCFLCHFAPPHPPPFQNCMPSVELNPRY